MLELHQVFDQYGYALVIAVVFIEQAGAPVPSFPLLIVAGALAASGELAWPIVLAGALAAALAGNLGWYYAGRHYGGRVLKLLCRVSISPDYCVQQTERTFEKYGTLSLLLAKFLPGLSMVAPPMAGMTGVALSRFVFFDGVGALVWAGAGLALGALFRREIDVMLDVLPSVGSFALLILGLLLSIYIAWKVWRRWKFLRAVEAARISAEDLYRLMQSDSMPVVLDMRSPTLQHSDPRRIPGALAFDIDRFEQEIARLPAGRDVVIYCACPHEAGAAKLAGMLREHGFHNARPLLGGLDAWQSAGLTLEKHGV